MVLQLELNFVKNPEDSARFDRRIPHRVGNGKALKYHVVGM